jgi:hypothetical protein
MEYTTNYGQFNQDDFCKWNNDEKFDKIKFLYIIYVYKLFIL